MTALVTGCDGQLGRALRPLLPTGRFVGRADVDITDSAALAALDWDGVDAIVNAAAWTAVDAAEEPANALRAWDVNATGVANLADHARRLDVPLVQVSTDYVFAGDDPTPVPVGAPLAPRSVYGATKAAGELAARLAPRCCVVRTSWLFGDGPNFVRTVRRLAAARDEVSVVDDQHGRPTYAPDLAAVLVGLLEQDCPPGTYHASGAGDIVSWADVAEAALVGTGCRVRRVTSEQYAASAPRGAARPAWSALDLSGLEQVGLSMRDWREALREYLAVEAERAA